jgi:hypothetical protein
MVDAVPETRIEQQTTMMNEGFKTLVLGRMKMFKFAKIMTVATMIAAMAAPALAGDEFASQVNGDWDTAGTWNNGVPNEGADVEVSDAVTVTTVDDGTMDDLKIHSGGIITHTADELRIQETFVIGDGSAGTYDISGGQLMVREDSHGPQTVGISGSAGLLKVSGTGSFAIDGAFNVDVNSTIQLIGSTANFHGNGLIWKLSGSSQQDMNGYLTGAGTLDFVADASGVTTMTLDTASATTLNLVVDLSNYVGSSDLTLMTIETGLQGAFASVMVDGEDQAANVSYTGGDGNDVVLSVPEPATMSLLAIGGLALLRRKRRRA